MRIRTKLVENIDFMDILESEVIERVNINATADSIEDIE